MLVVSSLYAKLSLRVLTLWTWSQHWREPVLHVLVVAVLAGAVTVSVTVTGGGTFQGVATARTESAKRVKKKVNTRLFILNDVSNGDL